MSALRSTRWHLSALAVVTTIAAAFALAAAATPGVHAQAVSSNAWRGDYFNNLALSGAPVLTREDSAIDFDWGDGAPSGRLASDAFSVRWERAVETPGGRYRIDVTSDDGVRVFLDGALLIDEWHDQASTHHAREVDVSPGRHVVRVEYFDRAGHASIRLTAEPVAAPAGGWRGEYFGNASLSGAPLLVRDDSAVDFDWGLGTPAQGVVPADQFSARWTKVIGFTPGRYRFTTTSDDGVRLWVNNRLVIDRWLSMSAMTVSDAVDVPGSAELRLEYFEGVGVAKVRLSWTADASAPSSQSSSSADRGAPVRYTVQWGDTLLSIAGRFKTTTAALRIANDLKGDAIYAGQTLWIPVASGPLPPSAREVVVDEQSASVLRGGSAAGWQRSTYGFGGSSWTLNNDIARADYNWLRWIPAIAPGRYEVFAFIPSRNANTHHAQYWVAHADGFGGRVIDQAAFSDVWVSLGTYRFLGNGMEYASLNDATGEPRLSRRVGFDAVKWVPR